MTVMIYLFNFFKHVSYYIILCTPLSSPLHPSAILSNLCSSIDIENILFYFNFPKKVFDSTKFPKLRLHWKWDVR